MRLVRVCSDMREKKEKGGSLKWILGWGEGCVLHLQQNFRGFKVCDGNPCNISRSRNTIRGDGSTGTSPTNQGLCGDLLFPSTSHKGLWLMHNLDCVVATNGLQRQSRICLCQAIAVARVSRLRAIVREWSLRWTVHCLLLKSVLTCFGAVSESIHLRIRLFFLPSYAAARSIVRVTPEEP
jgi:hypothetical protein